MSYRGRRETKKNSAESNTVFATADSNKVVSTNSE